MFGKDNQCNNINCLLILCILQVDKPEVDQFKNFNLTDIATPVDADELEKLLRRTNYDNKETRFLIKGFRKGFSLGYKGPKNRKDTSQNIPFTRVGDKVDMWNKIMKEVKLGRYAGPFTQIPFENYVQSPIGLVPKAGGQTRLIFHLSYNFKNGNKSINYWTPHEICSVHYQDIDHAVRNCIHMIKLREQENNKQGRQSDSTGKDQGSFIFQCLFFGKTDLKSAFRWVPMKGKHYFLLIMKAVNPETGETRFFVDKCMPFGASISCSHFQRLSNALKHVVESLERIYNAVTNYLDDFLFIHYIKQLCVRLMERFMQICQQIKFPVADEKTEWPGEETVVFLGMLLNGKTLTIKVPEDKRLKTLNMLQTAAEHKKLTIKEIQCLTGTLNFLNKAIVPGRVFTRRMYALLSSKMTDRNGNPLKQHYHINLTREFRNDCVMWMEFLSHQGAVNKKIMEFDSNNKPEDIVFFQMPVKVKTWDLVVSLINNGSLEDGHLVFIKEEDPSIAYLELYALCAGIFTWSDQIKGKKVLLHCDNQSVVQMVNNMTSGCGNCMYLLRMLMIDNLLSNRIVQLVYIPTHLNIFADLLSRQRIDRFLARAPEGTKIMPDTLPMKIWPISRIWQ